MDPPHKRPFLPGLQLFQKMLKLPRQEPVVKQRKQHNYVKPANSEYKGNSEELMDSQPGQSKGTQSHVYSRPRLTSERPRGRSVLAHYNRYECGRCAPSQLGCLTDCRHETLFTGLNSPRCHSRHTPLKDPRSRLDFRDLARDHADQSESRWFDIWELAFTELYFRLHWRTTNVFFFFIKIRADMT